MVELEVAEPNTNFYFRPVQRAIRGRFDLNLVPEPQARMGVAQWPLPIPAQRIGIDREGIGFIAEPLHDPAHAPLKERIEKRGQRLEPAQVVFETIDANTWHFWMRRAVESGLCRIVQGSIAANVDETAARKNFILADAEPTATDKLTAALDRQTAAFEGLTAAIGKFLESRK